MELDALRDFFDTGIPFNRFLGITVVELDRGRCTIRIPFHPDLIGDSRRPALHGGVVSTLADTAGGLAVWSSLDHTESRVSTVDIRVDYLRPGHAADLLCSAEVIRVGNRVGVTMMRVFQETDHLVAESRGVYNVRRGDDTLR